MRIAENLGYGANHTPLLPGPVSRFGRGRNGRREFKQLTPGANNNNAESGVKNTEYEWSNNSSEWSNTSSEWSNNGNTKQIRHGFGAIRKKQGGAKRSKKQKRGKKTRPTRKH